MGINIWIVLRLIWRILGLISGEYWIIYEYIYIIDNNTHGNPKICSNPFPQDLFFISCRAERGLRGGTVGTVADLRGVVDRNRWGTEQRWEEVWLIFEMIKHRNNGLGFKWNYWKTHLEIEDTLFHTIFIGEDMICQPNRFFVKNGIKLFDRFGPGDGH